MRLKGKTALITGAGRRIGRAISLELARGGANIVIHYRNSFRDALSLKEEIEAMHSINSSSPHGVRRGSDSRLKACGNDETYCKAFLLKFSFSNSGKFIGIKKFVRKAYRFTGKVDILVNNASVFYSTAFGKISEKDWDEIMTVNLKAPFFLSQEIGRRMAAADGGKIINLVDWVGERPAVNFIPYAISKAGLIAATRGLARALAPKVQVAAIAPGPILPAEGTAAKHKAVIKKSLLKRFGEPSDIANAVRFLVEGTDFVTGSVLYAEGGACIA